MSDNLFFSTDKLVEFGMGVSIASQLSNSMNQALNQMDIPGAGRAMPERIDSVYYAVIAGKQEGPFSSTELARLVAEKKITRETYIWKPGMKEWSLAEDISEVLQLVALTPPPIPESTK